MTGGISMTFDGGKALDAALKSLPDRVSRKFQREALTFAAEKHLIPAISRAAPVGPGGSHIRDSIIIRRSLQFGGTVAIAVGPERRAHFYGGFLEFGTSKMAAQPFMRPAFDTTNQAMLDTIARDLWVSLAGKGIHRTASADSGLGGGLV